MSPQWLLTHPSLPWALWPQSEGECHHIPALTLLSGILATLWLRCCTSTHLLGTQPNSPNLTHFPPAPGQAGPQQWCCPLALPLPRHRQPLPHPLLRIPRNQLKKKTILQAPCHSSPGHSSLLACISSTLFKFDFSVLLPSMPELPPLPVLCKEPEHDGHLLKQNGSVLHFLSQDHTVNLTHH